MCRSVTVNTERMRRNVGISKLEVGAEVTRLTLSYRPELKTVCFWAVLAAILILLSIPGRALIHVFERVSTLDGQLCWIHHGQFTLDGVQPRLMVWRICRFPRRVVLTGFMYASQDLWNDRGEWGSGTSITELWSFFPSCVTQTMKWNPVLLHF